jgi:membrane protease subunit (stomatin/prohibitin family)
MTKTRSAVGNYLPGMMRTGRTTENGDLNVIAGSERGQQKNDTSSQVQQRTTGVKTRSPSPARRTLQMNGGSQQQKTRAPAATTAAKHCHECGEVFPVEWAKFCCECGEKRLGLE